MLAKQSCRIQEFETNVYYTEEYKDWNSIGDVGLSVNLPDVETATNVWTTAYLVKTLTREYYIMPFGNLIGTVGGTLGLFIGVSFWDLGSALSNFARAGLLRLVTPKTRKPSCAQR